jgi:polyisoprenoid-binding protein YceI
MDLAVQSTAPEPETRLQPVPTRWASPAAPSPGKEISMTATQTTWTIDPVHSSVEFSLDYMGFSTYRTGFRALEGALEFDPARPASASVTASIPVASIDVANDRLMSRLMDPDLLGGKDHPTITFASTRVEAVDPARWRVVGALTLHGLARPVVLNVRYLGQARSWQASLAFVSESLTRDTRGHCHDRKQGLRRSRGRREVCR